MKSDEQNLHIDENSSHEFNSNHMHRGVRQPWGDAERAIRRQRMFMALKRLNVNRVREHGRAFVHRGHKWTQRRRTAHPTKVKCPVFILGSNRSGTQMVCEGIGHSPHGWDYRESEFSPAFSSYYLRADWLIKWLIRNAPAPMVSFGCILDSQFAPELLARFEGARAIWVYRRYADAANSTVRNWDHMSDLVRTVASGEPERLGARGKGISRDTERIFRELVHEDLSDEEGACLYWYMRNQLYFDLGLNMDARVLLVHYEDTVLNPERAFRRIFDFLGFPYHPDATTHVFAGSLGKNRWPGVEPRVQTLCDDLTARLDTQYGETINWTPELKVIV